MMGGKTNRLVNQEGRESYGDEADECATAIFQGNKEFVGAEEEFEAARTEESAARACSQRAGNLAGNTTGTAKEREEDKSEDNEARNRTHPTRNPVEQATGEVDTIFGEGNRWDNESAPLSPPHTMGIHGGADVMITQHATPFPVGGNATMA